jgi:hypothetical protein
MKEIGPNFALKAIAALGALVVGVSAFGVAAGAPAGQQHPAKDQQARMPLTMAFPDNFKGVGDWVPLGAPGVFNKDGLYGYVDGGAEIFLGYGFRKLTVFHLAPKGAPADGPKQITLEIYEMDSPEAAFGVFSTRRTGDEYVSPQLRTVHWIGAEQANFVKGVFYVNILASGCTRNEVEAFTLGLDRLMWPAESAVPLDLSWIPGPNVLPRSENFIKGEQAALALSPILGAQLWGFGEGGTEAFSLRYGPAPATLVLIRFKSEQPNLKANVIDLFRDYLAQAALVEDMVQGVSTTGEYYLFGQYGNTGVLILGDPDAKAARKRVEETLAAFERSTKKQE